MIDVIRFALSAMLTVSGLFCLLSAVVGVYREALGGKCRRNVVLGGEGVASRHVHLGAARAKHLGKVRGLCLKMDGHGNFQTRKGLGCLKIGADAVEHRHIGAHPLDLVVTGGSEGDVFDVAHDLIPFLHKIYAQKRRTLFPLMITENPPPVKSILKIEKDRANARDEECKIDVYRGVMSIRKRTNLI